MARVPRIAGGSGSLTHFAFSIHRTFRRDGKKQSYLQTSDGNRISGSILRRCRASG